MSQFKDKIAIVTGAGSGIGRALCLELARRGATAIAADIDADTARQTAEAITRDGGRAKALQVDVTSEEQVGRLVDGTVSEFGRLDYIFNNAGIAIGGEMRDLTVDHWRRVLNVDLYGVLHGTIAAYKVMVKQGFGHIVNIASAAGLLPMPLNAPYSTCKHAVVGLSLSLRIEAQDLGVKVSCVCPGYIESNIYQSTVVNAAQDRAMKQITQKKVSTARAAEEILEGVAANRGMIVFPAYINRAWFMYRLFPSRLEGMALKRVREFRTRQNEGGGRKES